MEVPHAVPSAATEPVAASPRAGRAPPPAADLDGVIARLARQPLSDNRRDDVRRVLEASAEALGVERVSLWLYASGRAAIECISLYRRSLARHEAGQRIEAAAAPAYFAEIAHARIVAVEHAARDPRTREFNADYLAPLGIASMLDAPVRVAGQLLGVVCHEHVGSPRAWTEREQAFAAGVADLTANLLQAHALRDEKDHLAALLRAQSDLGEAVCVITMTGRILYNNEALAEVTGYSTEELRALENAALVLRPPQAAPQWAERVRRLESGEAVSPRFETVLLHKSGHTVPIELCSKPITFQGEACRLAIVRDLTLAKRVEVELRILERLVQATSDAVITATPDGIITGWNPGAQRLLGYTEAEILGKHIRTYMPPDLEWEVARLARVIAGETLEPYETERQRADGRRVNVSVNLTPIRDHDGRIVAVTGILRDLSTRIALEQARRELAQSEKLSALGTLVSGVAHELRTPLTYLQNNLYLIRAAAEVAADARSDEAARAAARERLREHMESAQEGVERIEHLVGDLGRYTRLRGGGATPEDVSRVVAEAARLFGATHRGEVVVDLDAPPTRLRPLDRVQIQQVVLNLLENAADARPRDGRVRVQVRESTDGTVELEVKESGMGMPPDVAQRAFDPFYTTKPHGTGLGLSIVKRIVESHGGAIACESEPGEGTRIRIRLPAPPA